MSTRGVGYAVVAGRRAARRWSASRLDQRPLPARGPLRLRSTARTGPRRRSPRPTAATSRSRGAPTARTRAPASRTSESAFGPEFTISRPEFGPVLDPGVSISGDRVGDFAVAMVQGMPDGLRTLSVGHYDRAARRRPHRVPATTSARRAPSCAGARGSTCGARRSHPRVRRRRPGRPDAPANAGAARRRSRPARTRGRSRPSTRRARPTAAAPRTLRIDPIAPTLTVRVTRQRARRGQNLQIRVRATDTGGVRASTTSRSTTATARRRRSRPTPATATSAGRFTLKVAAVDKAGNVDAQAGAPADQVVILRAGSRTLELGARPLLMGILNASPDSFSDGREEPLEARIARGRALLAAGADILDIGGESARGDRPAVSAEDEIARVVPLVAALRGRDRLRRHLQAGGRGGRDRGRRGDHQRRLRTARRRRWPRCARAAAPRWCSCTPRVEPKGTLLDPATYEDVVADVVAFLRERMEIAVAAGMHAESLILDPGPDFAKTPAQSVAVLRASGRAAGARPSAAARRLAQGLRRRDHRPRGR